MKEKLNKIKAEALVEIEKAVDAKQLNDVRIKVLGKAGELTALLRGMRDVPSEERPIIGSLVNEVRDVVEGAIKNKEEFFAKQALEEKLRTEWVDVTLPSLRVKVGAPNIVEKVIEEVEEICMSMGYDVVDGTEIEEVMRKILFISRMRRFCLEVKHRQFRRELCLPREVTSLFV